MTLQPVKFYQKQTFTVGNRLVAGHARAVQANMRRTNSLNSGHRACQGSGDYCHGEALGVEVEGRPPRWVAAEEDDLFHWM